MMTAIAAADPSPPLINVGAHRHYVEQPNGSLREVGPRFCDDLENAGLQKAFNQFHANVHRVTEGAIGPVAPGLHNLRGAELSVGGCAQSQ
jgi:hypothetical protein